LIINYNLISPNSTITNEKETYSICKGEKEGELSFLDVLFSIRGNCETETTELQGVIKELQKDSEKGFYIPLHIIPGLLPSIDLDIPIKDENSLIGISPTPVNDSIESLNYETNRTLQYKDTDIIVQKDMQNTISSNENLTYSGIKQSVAKFHLIEVIKTDDSETKDFHPIPSNLDMEYIYQEAVKTPQMYRGHGQGLQKPLEDLENPMGRVKLISKEESGLLDFKVMSVNQRDNSLDYGLVLRDNVEFKKPFWQNILEVAHKSFKEVNKETIIRLEPESLGKMVFRFNFQNGELVARITVENSSVKDLLQNNLDNLKTTLNEQGIPIGNLDVSLGNSGNNPQQGFNWNTPIQKKSSIPIDKEVDEKIMVVEKQRVGFYYSKGQKIDYFA
jgi:hypothetical protein